MQLKPLMHHLLVAACKDPLMASPDSKIDLSKIQGPLTSSVVLGCDPMCNDATKMIGSIVYHRRESCTSIMISGKDYSLLHENSIVAFIPKTEVDLSGGAELNQKTAEEVLDIVKARKAAEAGQRLELASGMP